MASLHKHPRSPFWQVSYRDAEGRWRMRSSGSRSRAIAQRIANEWETLGKAGQEKRLTEAQARRVVSELLEQVTGEPLHFHSTRQWLNEWLTGKDGATAAATLVRYKQVVRDFITHLGPRAELPLGAISLRDVRGFRDALAKQGRSAETVNQTVRKVLSAPFAKAMQLGYIPTNPCVAVEPLKRVPGGEVEGFAAEQVATLLKCAEGDWHGAILAGCHTGLRLRDITELRWDAVDLEKRLIRVRTKKTGAQVVLPLHPELGAWLRKQTRGIGKAPVFRTLAGRKGSGKTGLSMQFRALMDRAGVKGRILYAGTGAGRTRHSLSFHSLRHTFVSALANAGVAVELRKRLAGHSDERVHQNYTHHEVDTLRDAVEKIANFGGG